MRKVVALIFAVILLTALCSCGNAELSSLNGSASGDAAETQTSSSSTDISVETAEPAQEETESPASNVDNKAREELFRTFLSENYQKISDSFLGGISGIGFIDLDIDGGIEMLIFDAGASAAMGVQFFDIVDDAVECVSANLESVGENFGSDHFSNIIVNANYFDDFRMMKDKSTGEKFYIVESGNGAADFSYNELIRFGNKKGILTLGSLMYKHEDYDMDSGKVTGQSFKVGGKDAEKAEYEVALNKFNHEAIDTGYDAQGVFMWENDYESSYEGLMAMAEKAFSLYEKQTNS